MQQKSANALLPTVILGAFFSLFGFVTWLNASLIQYLQLACELNDRQAYLVATAFYIAYFVTAIPSSWILQKTGMKKGMMLGLIVMAFGALLFIPAARTRTFELFLAGLFVIGTGLSILQTASNPYITIIGPIESAARRISIMGICNKVAGVLGPVILGSVILKDADALQAKLKLMDALQKASELDGIAARVILPYACMTAALVLLAVLVRFSPLPELEAQGGEGEAVSFGGILKYPALVLGVVSLFLYVGAEVIAGDTIGLYGKSLGIPTEQSRFFPSYTLSAMVLGYLIGIFAIPRYVSQARALAFSALVGMILSLAAVLSSGYTSVLCIALLGLANALMWPAIWPLSIEGLGKYTQLGSALLIMAIAGGALLPQAYGWLGDLAAVGKQNAYLLLLPLYLFIFWFAMRGHKIKAW